MDVGRGVRNDLTSGEEKNRGDGQPSKTYLQDFVVNPPRALSAVLRPVITVVKGRQVTEIARHLFHLHIFDDLVNPLLMPKVRPFCRGVSIH